MKFTFNKFCATYGLFLLIVFLMKNSPNVHILKKNLVLLNNPNLNMPKTKFPWTKRIEFKLMNFAGNKMLPEKALFQFLLEEVWVVLKS